ncbi:UvrD-helicase domain-containing protein [Joostella sp. CR20]|uniref:UvrD-helicase domain-containing protein n=1 Tax=Joostella sp. CR20 TaxID=2804312 RepID=UPI00313D608F
MLNSAPFQIYNASAGSGKTFTLVKNYLSILLSNNQQDTFKQILAITFTNKAVNEMKGRVLSNLHEFSEERILEEPSDIFSVLAEELNISPEVLHQRAKKVLTRILHNYAFFDIVTIDKFNHRLIRTFSFDLKLPTNFEVSLDEDALLSEAVNNVIYQAGENKLLTKTLIDFALEKTDDDRSWDIARDLNKIAKLLPKEEYALHIQQLENKSLDDFKALGKQLKTMITELDAEIQKSAEDLLDLFVKKGLERLDFKSGWLYDRLVSISNKKYTHSWESGWFLKIESDPLYTDSLLKKKPAQASIIDELQSRISFDFIKIKESIFQLNFLNNFYKNLVPLSLLSTINIELNKLKKDRNLLLISEFNRLISSAIANQPAPFIYERIGEKYKYYFIDEFQDTSTMQWNNMHPLISNALEAELPSGKTGSLMIVGDAKQAIYRWRGGKAEQFIDLYNEKNPFQALLNVENLPKNYRSFNEIVGFNNSFFNHIAQFLNNPTYQELFAKYSKQELNNKPGGYIDLTFIDPKDNKQSEEDLYCYETYQNIVKSVGRGFKYGDICIITRSRKNGVSIANYLVEREIPIISSETLLLKNDKKVAFLCDLLAHFNQPADAEIHLKILEFLAERNKIENRHAYFSEGIHHLNDVFSAENFNANYFLQLPLYNAIEYAINAFNLVDEDEAYLQFFLDEIMAFSQNNNNSISSFISYWEQKKDKLSIVAPSSSDAVQIMTIHKSKGLEFPVVIYPYADTDIYYEREFNMWFPVAKELFGIDYALFSSKSVLENINQTGKQFIDEHKEQQELDNINLLYVTLTRAVEQLFIICKKDITAKGVENTKTFAGMFINYLKARQLWSDSQHHYTIGNPEKKPTKKKEQKIITTNIPFISNSSFGNTFELVTKSGSLWDTKQKEAIDKGNVYHYLLSKIFYADDVLPVIEEAVSNGVIPKEATATYTQYLENLTQHDALKKYFSTEYTIYNEREIITADGAFIRPDRFVVKNNQLTIIDYKTGSPSEDYIHQINNYAENLATIGYTIEEKLLVFINENIQIIKA